MFLPLFPHLVSLLKQVLLVKTSTSIFFWLILPCTKSDNPDGIYLFKVNNRNSRRMSKIWSQLEIMSPELVSVLLTFSKFHTLR